MITFLPLLPQHWPAVKDIYEEGIKTGHATFHQAAPGWDEWNSNHLTHSRIVAMVDNVVAGWGALTPVSGRCVYAGVGEVSVYVAERFRGQKIGNALLQELIKQSESNNIWTLQAGIFPENKGSIKIHETNGFRTVGYREKIGQMNGVWRDTILMERRSNVVG
ncbi:MAG TPA: GNAT family N-acetyltransferase [Chitinophagaceae bacterium]|nr:GNAT family N-acetyltransferase [Chitinophagaceae bacterium]